MSIASSSRKPPREQLVSPTQPPTDNTTLTDVLDRYAAAGFTAEFETVESNGAVYCLECGTIDSAAAYSMHSLRRLEGASDPADMIAVVAITCCNCGADGVLVLTYGPGGNAADADILSTLADVRDDAVLPSNSAPGEAIGDN